MDPVFAWIENSALSDWVRDSPCTCAFPIIVTLHNIGMAFLAGGSIVIDLRLIGFASTMPLKPMARFVPLLWLAFSVIAATGILLLVAYPTKALTNPLFYIKLCLVAVAIGLVYRIATHILRGPSGADPELLPRQSQAARRRLAARPGSPSSRPAAIWPTRTNGKCSASPPSCSARGIASMEMAPWEVWVRSTELHALRAALAGAAAVAADADAAPSPGFTLLIGTVGFFDLRARGVAKGIPLRAIRGRPGTAPRQSQAARRRLAGDLGRPHRGRPLSGLYA